MEANTALEKEKISDIGKGIRNFKQSSDVENLYRFIHDNGLRREAKLIFDVVWAKIGKKSSKSKKKASRKSKKAKLQ